MHTRTMIAVILAALAAQSSPVASQEVRETNNEHLTRYNSSGGLAYWHNSKIGSDPTGTEIMVRRCNRPELQVSTKPLFEMRGVTKLLLHDADFTDAELEGISQMNDLPALLINGEITDDGLKHLENLTSLRILWIYQTQVTGTGLRHLQNLPKLEYLYLDSELSEDGFAQLE